MTQPDDTPQAPSGKRVGWRIFAPIGTLAIAAAAWSGFWFFAAHKADEAVEVWLKREATLGRVYDCGNRSLGGYPFRIEIGCETLVARFPGDGGEVVATAPRFEAVAQVYDPKRLIGEIRSPLTITTPDGRKADLSFSLAQASARVEGRVFERGSLAITAPRLIVGQDELGAAEAFEAHVRRAPSAAAGTYDLAASVTKATSSMLDLLPVGAGPVSLEFQAETSGLDDLRPRPTAERLRDFAAAGGEMKVALARIERGDVAAEAKGKLRLDAEGRANGKLDVTARGVEGLVKAMTGGDEGDAVSQLLGAGAALLGKKAELDGRPASTYKITVDKGRVSLGPVRIMKLPPAF